MAQIFEKLEMDQPDTINNLDTMELVNWIDATLKACGRCGSASQFESEKADLVTVQGLFAHIAHRFQSHVEAPHLWLPNAHPRPQPVPSAPDLVRVENPTFNQFMSMLIALRTQLLFSESAAKMSGYNSREVTDAISPLMQKLTTYIADAIDDLENSSHSYVPDVDDQAAPANPGKPR